MECMDGMYGTNVYKTSHKLNEPETDVLHAEHLKNIYISMLNVC